MTKEERKKMKLLEAKERLTQKGFKDKVKKDMDHVLSYYRPEYVLSSDEFKKVAYKFCDEYIEISKKDIYDDYEKEIIRNTATKFLEIVLMGFHILAR
jgi:valyl-tRNA synthetase